MKRIIISLLCLCLLLPSVVNAQTENVCFCVALAREYSPGVPRLDAHHWHLLPYQTRSVPVLGGQILMRYETQWDVATIEGFGPLGFEVVGVDFDTCKETRRVILYNDPRIHSFYDF